MSGESLVVISDEQRLHRQQKEIWFNVILYTIIWAISTVITYIFYWKTDYPAIGYLFSAITALLSFITVLCSVYKLQRNELDSKIYRDELPQDIGIFKRLKKSYRRISNDSLV
jgi:uncharacterized membrane protein